MTGSSQTVCQMPLVGVYQMPLGLRTCLPRGWVPASVGSQAVTINSFGAGWLERVGNVEAERVVAAPVLADFLAVDPDRGLEIHRAEMQQQRAGPAICAGTSKVRRYQMRSFSLTGRITPDNADSTGNGTRICVWKVARLASLLVMAKSHRPLRLSQSCRTIWGRGYSGWAFSGDTSLAHRVFSGPTAGCQAAGTTAGQTAGRPGSLRQPADILGYRFSVSFVMVWVVVY